MFYLSLQLTAMLKDSTHASKAILVQEAIQRYHHVKNSNMEYYF